MGGEHSKLAVRVLDRERHQRISGEFDSQLVPTLGTWLAVTPESVRGRALGGLPSAVFLGRFVSRPERHPLSDTIELGPVFLVLGGLMAVSAVGFGIATVSGLVADPPVPGAADQRSGGLGN